MTTATLCLPVPRFDWLLPAKSSLPKIEIPAFNLMLQFPTIKQAETMEATAENNRNFLEMAYRRWLQTPDDYFRVSQWYYGPGGQGVKEVHPHKRVANDLVMVGLLKPHHGNNGSRSKYRISQAGIVYVEDVLERWIELAPHDPAVWLPKFESYARQLARDEWLILPEPGRSWAFEQAFENERGRRSLHRVKPLGWPDGHGWAEHERYFYSQPGYDYRESEAFKHFLQPVRMDIPF